ncbi:hypothetical protein LJR066_002223 [Acidovorax sp. LjRoot66]|uniref:hypothetical protein n=1 Tax=Acidovorax sp. LjRoot66 TaxID=3342334 RepID=UPI003ED0B349
MHHNLTWRSAVPLALAVATTLVTAQPSDLLLEACNRLPDAKKRLACFKEATRRPADALPTATPTPSPASTPAAALNPAPASTTAQLPPLPLAEAVRLCTRLITVARGREAEATESAEASSASEMSVTWPALPGKKPVYCNLGRADHRITSITSNGKVASGALLDSMHARATQREEIQAGNYARLLAGATKALTSRMQDPDTAQFRNLFVSDGPLHMLCGEIDARNAFGAYEGFRRFYASGDPEFHAIESRKTTRVFEATWTSVCARKMADIAAF